MSMASEPTTALHAAIRDLPAASAAVVPRKVDYLRLSVTDRCNERCLYCLPESFSAWTDREELLTWDEFLAIVRAAVRRGFRHFRVTGGEPLIRDGIVDFIERLVATPGVETVQLTTNGTRLPELAPALRKAGLERINISLDALDPDTYHHITRGHIAPVLEGIALCKALGFPSIKLNTVLMRGKNEDQIDALVAFAARNDTALRFIELMPISLTEMLNESNFLPAGEVFQRLAARSEMIPLEVGKPPGHGPAKYYRMKETGATLGFIGALTDLHFCDACNKVRLTSDGKLRPCLGNHLEIDLKAALRSGQPASEVAATLDSLFLQTLAEKPLEHLFRNNYQPSRVMTAIGG
ncbi:cyclic pyranopterin monophosphate synthase subunit MoaA [Verrucomicrobium sp. GAS474]|uniref:GTP 3',8-cyclase MoaA n=1 Tax=Verrucomicrobium sp. GAS474 TaxID=1882831 RepID=UPI0008796963|nr:GTP 3',8-cyclase MoaA [Verrucomicrobium sp. GAS474]SDU25650.1 cyclic pyranopterin monophosphate synthase subunit MoaA [Verrucomicrobium sp. GAS474]